CTWSSGLLAACAPLAALKSNPATAAAKPMRAPQLRFSVVQFIVLSPELLAASLLFPYTWPTTDLASARSQDFGLPLHAVHRLRCPTPEAFRDNSPSTASSAHSIPVLPAQPTCQSPFDIRLQHALHR